MLISILHYSCLHILGTIKNKNRNFNFLDCDYIMNYQTNSIKKFKFMYKINSNYNKIIGKTADLEQESIQYYYKIFNEYDLKFLYSNLI